MPVHGQPELDRVLVAPDKFKDSLTAAQAAHALAVGFRSARSDLDVVELPVADGGDGTVAAALAAGFSPVEVDVEGPVGAPVRATFARRADTAVLELAEAAGLRRLPGGKLAPLTASTYGVGQLVAAALDSGATTIVIGVGGSASTDGGAGLIQALGARLADSAGRDLGRGGAELDRLALVDIGGLDTRLAAARFFVASDVSNPLLGPTGAAAVFAPQKGATAADVAYLDRALARWAQLTRPVTGFDAAGQPGAGAAGGTGFAALAYLNARLVPGIDLVLELVAFDAALAGSRLVITGEGSLDEQTLAGKAPLGVARAAARRAVPVIAVAGRVLLTAEQCSRAGFAATYSLAALEPDEGTSIREAASLLTAIGAQIGSDGLPG